MTHLLTEPILQFGAFAFAGFCLLIIAWMVKRVLVAFGKNSEVNAHLADMISHMNETQHEQSCEIRKLTDQLLQRPCLIRKEKIDAKQE